MVLFHTFAVAWLMLDNVSFVTNICSCTQYIITQLGPLSIHLTAGEFQVILSILEYSIPRLTGWSIMFEHAMESSVNQQERSGQPQSDNYQGGGKGGFFDSHDVPF